MIDDEESDGMLCPRCVSSNPVHAEYCARCGAPLGMMAAIDPFKQTLSEGIACRQAVEGSPKVIVVIGMWLLFLPGLLGLPLAVIDQSRTGPPGFVVAAYFAVSAVILYRTTVNFVRERRRLRDMPAED